MAMVVRNQKETDGVMYCFPNSSSFYLQENNLNIFPCCWYYYNKSSYLKDIFSALYSISKLHQSLQTAIFFEY